MLAFIYENVKYPNVARENNVQGQTHQIILFNSLKKYIILLIG
jgi:hypothetical protein